MANEYATAADFRRALEYRLRRRARDRRVPLARLRKLVTFDRFLARLATAAPERWLLKGALALEFRLGDRARTTMDLDLAGRGDADAATSDLLAACDTDLGDFFVFHAERSRSPERGAVRFRLEAEVDARLFETVLVDVGIADPFVARFERASGPDLLAFAGIPPVEFPILAIEQHVAEKVHAYTRRYSGDRPSGRVKDLVDLLLIATSRPVDGRVLQEALESTFAVRGLHPLPAAFPAPPREWRTSFGRLAAEVGVIADLAEAHSTVSRFLDPVLAGSPLGAWDPAKGEWSPGQ